MSIKLSIKDLKDLLKINKQAIKKRKRRRNKRLSKNTIDNNYNKSSSDHMKSIGYTNTSNEATELIRLQRQSLEDKLKNDKEDRIKKQNQDRQDQHDQDINTGLVVRNPLQNNGGSSDLRKEVTSINNTLNYWMMGGGNTGGTLDMVKHGSSGDPTASPKNAYIIDDGTKIEEIGPSQGAVFENSDDEDEEVPLSPIHETPSKEKETTLAPTKKPSLKTFFGGMFKPKEEEKQPYFEPSNTAAGEPSNTAAGEPSNTAAIVPESKKKPKKEPVVKDAAVEETEQNIDPDTLDIESLKSAQLVGWINYKRGNMDTKLLRMSKPTLQEIARSIKEEEAAEAKAAKKAAAAAKKAAKSSNVK